MLAQKLQQLNIAYLHLSINPAMEDRTLEGIRNAFTNTLIICNGLTPQIGEALLQQGQADLVAFGKSILANPNFAQKVANDVKTSGQARALEPMNSSDRKIVHDALAEVEGISTRSEGSDPFRRVVVALASVSEDFDSDEVDNGDDSSDSD